MPSLACYLIGCNELKRGAGVADRSTSGPLLSWPNFTFTEKRRRRKWREVCSTGRRSVGIMSRKRHSEEKRRTECDVTLGNGCWRWNVKVPFMALMNSLSRFWLLQSKHWCLWALTLRRDRCLDSVNIAESANWMDALYPDSCFC